MPTVPDTYTPDPTLDALFKANPPGKPSNASGQVDMITKHAQRVGIDPSWLKKIVRVESGGDPKAVTGSYKGLFQLSRREFTRHGGSGDILDPEQNTMAAANKIAAEKTRFEQAHGRPATLMDIYGIHQQGEAGYSAHLDNPQGTAWQNVRKYYPSDAVAKAAIWGNMTPAMKAKYGSVDNVTSGNFISDWSGRLDTAAPISGAMAKSRARHKGVPEDAGELQEKPKPEPDVSISVPDTTRVVQANVEAPSFSMGRPLSAPMLPRAGRVPQ